MVRRWSLQNYPAAARYQKRETGEREREERREARDIVP
jgi:hypothetical protein